MHSNKASGTYPCPCLQTIRQRCLDKRAELHPRSLGKRAELHSRCLGNWAGLLLCCLNKRARAAPALPGQAGRAAPVLPGQDAPRAVLPKHPQEHPRPVPWCLWLQRCSL